MTPRISLALTLSALLIGLTACGGVQVPEAQPTPPTTSAMSSAAPPSQTTTAADPRSPSGSISAPTANLGEALQADPASPSDDCAELSGDQALTRYLDRVPPAFPDADWEWSAASADVTGYHPCAALSWIVVGTGDTVSSPYQIMLFHRGEYLGTTFEDAPGYLPGVSRVADHEIAVTYWWPRDDESNATPSGTTNATFTFDAATGSVKHAGGIPPGIAGGPTLEEAEAAVDGRTGGSMSGASGAEDDSAAAPSVDEQWSAWAAEFLPTVRQRAAALDEAGCEDPGPSWGSTCLGLLRGMQVHMDEAGSGVTFAYEDYGTPSPALDEAARSASNAAEYSWTTVNNGGAHGCLDQNTPQRSIPRVSDGQPVPCSMHYTTQYLHQYIDQLEIIAQ